MEIEKEYPYQMKWTTILCGLVFFSLFAIVTGAKACFNESGSMIKWIRLSPAETTFSFWILFSFGIALVLIFGMQAWHHSNCKRRIAFTASAIIMPVSRWGSSEKTIEFAAISDLSTSCEHGHRTIFIDCGGKRHLIQDHFLPSTSAFVEILVLLNLRTTAARQTSSQ